jgi:ribosomal-protein-alanine N-acetyltransferase
MLSRHPAGPADLDGFVAHYGVPEVYRHLWDGEPAPRDAVAAILATSETDFATHGYGLWAVRDPDVPVAGIIGTVGLRQMPDHPGRVEVIYSLDPAYWGRGHATRLAADVLDHGFERCGLSEILAGTDPPNEASQRVMARLGMHPIGTLVTHGVATPYWAIDRVTFTTRPR